MMTVVEDRATGRICANIPMEGDQQGGFGAWGRYTPEIAENLRVISEVRCTRTLPLCCTSAGGVSVKPILAEGMQMGDEKPYAPGCR